MPISRKGGKGTFSKDTRWKRENKIYSKDYNYSGEKDFERWGLGFFLKQCPVLSLFLQTETPLNKSHI